MVMIGEHIFTQTLTDRCYIDTRTTGNEWGASRAGVTYTNGTTLIACRVVRHEAKEYLDQNKTRVIHAAIFLPADIAPNEDDRIRVTKRAQQTLATAEVFAVVGLERQGYGNKAECTEAKGATVI